MYMLPLYDHDKCKCGRLYCERFPNHQYCCPACYYKCEPHQIAEFEKKAEKIEVKYEKVYSNPTPAFSGWVHV